MAAARLVASVEGILSIAKVPAVALVQPAKPSVPAVGDPQLKPDALVPVVNMMMSEPGVVAVTVVLETPSPVALTPAAAGQALNANAKFPAWFTSWALVFQCPVNVGAGPVQSLPFDSVNVIVFPPTASLIVPLTEPVV